MIKLIYFTLCITGLSFILSSCNEAQPTANVIQSVSETPAAPTTVRKPQEETFVRAVNPTPVASKSRILKRVVVKDSLNELRAQYTLHETIIDSLNKVKPLFDNSLYNNVAVSYFSSLADSLHGRSYFADNSDGVMLSVMDILTTRINQGTDIVFLVDKTGSMDDDIETVKNSLNMIMSYLSQFNNVKVAMAFYGDKNHHYDLWYNRTNLTNNIRDIERFMDTYSTVGNPDVPESVNDGIVKTVEEMNWTPGNRRLMLVIGDAQSQLPPYSGYSQAQVIRKCDSMQVKFNLYPIIIASKQKAVEAVKISEDFVTVFPNPANDVCHIKAPGLETTYYEILDMTGRKMINSYTNGTTADIDVNDLPSGNYLIQIYNQDLSRYYSKPLIVQH
ncbi:MAG: T9SS type A sorting domain-containing protein [Bacteroidota bacterium]